MTLDAIGLALTHDAPELSLWEGHGYTVQVRKGKVPNATVWFDGRILFQTNAIDKVPSMLGG